MQESRSTLRSTEGAPICSRSDGKGRSIHVRPINRSSGAAQISECTGRVDLGAPSPQPRCSPSCRSTSRAVDSRLCQQRDCQVALGVAAQVLHDALGLRVACVAEVGGKPVMTGQADIVRSRGRPHRRPRRLLRQAIRSARTRAGTPPMAVQRFGDQRNRGGCPLVGGEGHKAPSGECEHSAEQEQSRCGLGPVDHQILTW